MTVREIQTIDELLPLRDVWHALLASTPRASFFQSLDWLTVYWEHYGAMQRLRTLVVEENNEVVGILPLVVRRERTKLGTLRFATYPLDHWGSYYGPLGARPEQVWAAGLDYLQSIRRDWDVFEPRWIGGEDDQCEQLERTLAQAGYSPIRTALDPTAVINLAGTWDDYRSARGSKWRNNLNRWNRHLEKLGDVEYVRYRPEAAADADPRWDYYDQCVEIAAASWQGSSTTGTTLSHESVAPFLRDAHHAAARYGSLDLNMLTIDGRAVAFAYNYVYHGNVFGLRVGYLPGLSTGIGNVLYTKAIEDSFTRGDWRYDMGPRHLDCKRKLLTDVLPIYRLSCYRTLSLRQQLMKFKRQRDARSNPIAPLLDVPSVTVTDVANGTH